MTVSLTTKPPSGGDYVTLARRLPTLQHVHDITNFPKALGCIGAMPK
jgi:hypothetical protein